MTDRKALAIGISSKVLQLVFSVLIARVIAPDDYGTASAIILAANLLFALAELGAPETIIRVTHLSVRFLAGYLVTAVVVLMVSAVALLQFEFVMQIVGRTMTSLPLVVLLAAMMLLSVYLDAVVRRAHKFMLLAVRTLVCTIISSLVGLSLALIGYGYQAIIAQAYVFSGLNVLMLVSTVVGMRHQFSLERRLDANFLRFAAPLYLQRITETVANRGAELLVIAQLGIFQYGLFALSFRLGQTLLQAIATPYNDILFARLARPSYDDGVATQHFLTALRTVVGCVSSVFCILAISAPEVVRLLYGARWTEAGTVLSAVLFLGALQSAQFLNGPFILTRSGSVGLLSVSLVKNISVIGLLVVFPPLDALGAALIMLAGQAISTPLSYYLTLRALKIGPFTLLYKVFPALCTTTIVTGLALACRTLAEVNSLPLTLGILVSVAVPLAATLAIAARFDPVVSSDLRRLWRRSE